MAAKWFPARLQELRDQKGLTQQQLADKIGVTRVTIARWEIGEREPTWSYILDLCEALEVSCEAFTKAPKKKK